MAAGIICDVFGAPETVRLVIQSEGLSPIDGATHDVAALGLVRPPLVYLVAIVTGAFRTGPYRFSRNPIYLAFSLIHLGIASWANSVWLLATLVGAVALIHYVVIRREERYLERRFGAEYLAYKASVRRWL